MQLSKEDMQLLVMLKSNPIISMNKLAQKLNIAPNTVKIRLEGLKKRRILRQDDTIQDPILGKRKITEIISYANPYSLGLKAIDFLLNDISSYSDYILICNFLDKHPYTTYRALVMGQGINIYCKFQIPPKEQELLETFLSYVRSQKLFKDYIMIDPTEMHRSETNLSRWNIELYKSEPNESSIEALFYIYKNNISDDLPKVPTTHPKPKIKEMDLKILRELTINGKASVNYIASFYDKEVSTISRKMQKVKNLYISHYNIAYDKTIFHQGSEFLIYGKMEKTAKYALKKLILEKNIPFLIKYVEDTKYFIMRIEAPPIFVNDMVRLIAPHCSVINQLNLHKKTNVRYFFYYQNYDFEKRLWRGGEDYMIHEPLRN